MERATRHCREKKRVGSVFFFLVEAAGKALGVITGSSWFPAIDLIIFLKIPIRAVLGRNPPIRYLIDELYFYSSTLAGL